MPPKPGKVRLRYCHSKDLSAREGRIAKKQVSFKKIDHAVRGESVSDCYLTGAIPQALAGSR